jgi:hypothetical protein
VSPPAIGDGPGHVTASYLTADLENESFKSRPDADMLSESAFVTLAQSIAMSNPNGMSNVELFKVRSQRDPVRNRAKRLGAELFHLDLLDAAKPGWLAVVEEEHIVSLECVRFVDVRAGLVARLELPVFVWFLVRLEQPSCHPSSC